MYRETFDDSPSSGDVSQGRNKSLLFAAAGLIVSLSILAANKLHFATIAQLTDLCLRLSFFRKLVTCAPLWTASVATAAIAVTAGWSSIYMTAPFLGWLVMLVPLVMLDAGVAELARFPDKLEEMVERADRTWVRHLQPALRDGRQIVLVQHIVDLMSVLAGLLLCFVVLELLAVATWMLLVAAAVIYVRANGFWQEIIHIDSHMRFMSPRSPVRGRKRALRVVQWLSDWILSQFFGMFPYWYVTEHVGNHHPEVNSPADVEAIGHYDRTSFLDFADLCGRLIANTTTGWGMYRYLLAAQRRRYVMLAATGAIGHAATVAIVFYWSVPLGIWLIISSLGFGFSLALIAVSDHGLADPQRPGDVYTNSYNVLWTLDDHGQYGAKYHLTHHLNPAPTWGPRTDALARQHQETVFREKGSILFHPFAYPDDLLKAFWRDDADFLYPYVAAVGGSTPTPHEWRELFAQRVRPARATSPPAWIRHLSRAAARLTTSHIPPPAV